MENLNVLGTCVASQDELHRQFSGVVPEIAARAHVERILPVIDTALKNANLQLSDISAVGVAHTPGLAGSLLVGLTAAKSISMAMDVPLISINHLHAHVFACQMDQKESVFPCVGMIVSGGHTHLYKYTSTLEHQFLGGTIDDAAGEAFDKVASMLGLPYPGGPHVSKSRNTVIHKLIISLAVSFTKIVSISVSAVLKTAVRYAITGPGKSELSDFDLEHQQKADLAASFQKALVDCLVIKALQACQQHEMSRLCIGGGVAANKTVSK